MHTPTVKLSSIATALLLGMSTSVISLASAGAAQGRGFRTNSGFGRSTQELRENLNRSLMSGRLTTQEFDQIRTHEQTVESHLQRAKAQGVITAQERMRLGREQHQVVQKTRDLIDQNRQHQGHANSLAASKRKLVHNVRQGFKSGTLTRQEVQEIKRREKNIHTKLQKGRANGSLTAQQRHKAEREQDRLEQKVKQVEANPNNPQG